MRPRILVIEDDPALVELLEYNLVAAGYGVATAASAEEGQLLLAEQGFEVKRLTVREPK